MSMTVCQHTGPILRRNRPPDEKRLCTNTTLIYIYIYIYNVCKYIYIYIYIYTHVVLCCDLFCFVLLVAVVATTLNDNLDSVPHCNSVVPNQVVIWLFRHNGWFGWSPLPPSPPPISMLVPLPPPPNFNVDVVCRSGSGAVQFNIESGGRGGGKYIAQI